MERTRIRVWVTKFGDRPFLQLQYIDPVTGKKKTRSAGTADPQIADDKRGDLEADLNAGRHADPSRLSWQAFRELYTAEHLSGTRPATQTSYTAGLDLFTRLTSPTTLRGVSERTISAFVASLRRDDYLPSSIHVYLSYLHAALAWARRQKLIPAVPDFPLVKVPRKRPQPVPEELTERLLAAATLQQRAFLLCGWLAGLRRSEAYYLEWEPSERFPWLDLERKRIWLPAGFVKAVEDQWIAVHPDLEAALLALRLTNLTPQAERLTGSFSSSNGARVFHFTGSRGPLSPASVSSEITVLARKVGVRLSMRSMRRGFACKHAASQPAQVLQRLLRHASIQTTVSYYANVDSAAEEAILGRASGNTSADSREKGALPT